MWVYSTGLPVEHVCEEKYLYCVIYIEDRLWFIRFEGILPLQQQRYVSVSKIFIIKNPSNLIGREQK